MIWFHCKSGSCTWCASSFSTANFCNELTRSIIGRPSAPPFTTALPRMRSTAFLGFHVVRLSYNCWILVTIRFPDPAGSSASPRSRTFKSKLHPGGTSFRSLNTEALAKSTFKRSNTMTFGATTKKLHA